MEYDSLKPDTGKWNAIFSSATSWEVVTITPETVVGKQGKMMPLRQQFKEAMKKKAPLCLLFSPGVFELGPDTFFADGAGATLTYPYPVVFKGLKVMADSEQDYCHTDSNGSFERTVISVPIFTSFTPNAPILTVATPNGVVFEGITFFSNGCNNNLLNTAGCVSVNEYCSTKFIECRFILGYTDAQLALAWKAYQEHAEAEKIEITEPFRGFLIHRDSSRRDIISCPAQDLSSRLIPSLLPSSLPCVKARHHVSFAQCQFESGGTAVHMIAEDGDSTSAKRQTDASNNFVIDLKMDDCSCSGPWLQSGIVCSSSAQNTTVSLRVLLSHMTLTQLSKGALAFYGCCMGLVKSSLIENCGGGSTSFNAELTASAALFSDNCTVSLQDSTIDNSKMALVSSSISGHSILLHITGQSNSVVSQCSFYSGGNTYENNDVQLICNTQILFSDAAHIRFSQCNLHSTIMSVNDIRDVKCRPGKNSLFPPPSLILATDAVTGIIEKSRFQCNKHDLAIHLLTKSTEKRNSVAAITDLLVCKNTILKQVDSISEAMENNDELPRYHAILVGLHHKASCTKNKMFFFSDDSDCGTEAPIELIYAMSSEDYRIYQKSSIEGKCNSAQANNSAQHKIPTRPSATVAYLRPRHSPSPEESNIDLKKKKYENYLLNSDLKYTPVPPVRNPDTIDNYVQELQQQIRRLRNMLEKRDNKKNKDLKDGRKKIARPNTAPANRDIFTAPKPMYTRLGQFYWDKTKLEDFNKLRIPLSEVRYEARDSDTPSSRQSPINLTKRLYSEWLDKKLRKAKEKNAEQPHVPSTNVNHKRDKYRLIDANKLTIEQQNRLTTRLHEESCMHKAKTQDRVRQDTIRREKIMGDHHPAINRFYNFKGDNAENLKMTPEKLKKFNNRLYYEHRRLKEQMMTRLIKRYEHGLFQPKLNRRSAKPLTESQIKVYCNSLYKGHKDFEAASKAAAVIDGENPSFVNADGVPRKIFVKREKNIDEWYPKRPTKILSHEQIEAYSASLYRGHKDPKLAAAAGVGVLAVVSIPKENNIAQEAQTC